MLTHMLHGPSDLIYETQVPKPKLSRVQNVKKKILTKKMVAGPVIHSFTQTVFINAKYVPDLFLGARYPEVNTIINKI